eukprot:scaffold138681_cov28-Tisochrysis_lutea.AAC.2
MACTIVPLYPNEFTPPKHDPAASMTRTGGDDRCTGNEHATPPRALLTCWLMARSWAFGDVATRHSTSEMLKRPERPAAGSACPAFAFTLHKEAASTSLRPASKAATDRASIGSPSCVPVPCASNTATAPGSMDADERASAKSERCACPFGAVRLALLPSWRTQLPMSSGASITS